MSGHVGCRRPAPRMLRRPAADGAHARAGAVDERAVLTHPGLARGAGGALGLGRGLRRRWCRLDVIGGRPGAGVRFASEEVLVGIVLVLLGAVLVLVSVFVVLCRGDGRSRPDTRVSRRDVARVRPRVPPAPPPCSLPLQLSSSAAAPPRLLAPVTRRGPSLLLLRHELGRPVVIMVVVGLRRPHDEPTGDGRRMQVVHTPVHRREHWIVERVHHGIEGGVAAVRGGPRHRRPHRVPELGRLLRLPLRPLRRRRRRHVGLLELRRVDAGPV